MKWLVLTVGLLACGTALAGDEPEGYRDGDYRSPVPETLSGATVLNDVAAHTLWETGTTLFVDVLPKAPKPEKLPKGTIWREPKRKGIPGAIWLPNVGYGRIHETVNAYFQDNLAANTTDRDHPIVFYCLADCWMSWNAAKRAMTEYGYTRVFWYPDGTDGWEFSDYPMEQIIPIP